MADRFALPDLPNGLYLLSWLFDEGRWQLVVGTDPEDTTYQDLAVFDALAARATAAAV